MESNDRDHARERKRLLLVLALCLLFAGCEGAPSALDAAGPGAARIAGLWWVLLGMASFVTIGVIVLLAMALMARPREGRPSERRNKALIVGGGIVLPGVMIPIIIYLTFTTLAQFPEVGTDRHPLEETDPAHNLTVRVIGHQFWWEVHYPEHGIVTANQIHIPVGQPVRFEVTSVDVIHSLWVPQLHGKIDAMPGRINVIHLEADRPGTFRGICAEFCGLQHAHMYFHVVVEPEQEFSAWLEEQRQPAETPVTPLAQRGKELFMTGSCAACHAIEGTAAVAREGPDLTHLMRREWIASGMLPNTVENLTLFVDDPQGVKPGNRMPPAGLGPDDLEALISYLATLD